MYFTTTNKRGNKPSLYIFSLNSFSLSLSLCRLSISLSWPLLSSADLFRAVTYIRGSLRSRWNRFLDNSSASARFLMKNAATNWKFAGKKGRGGEGRGAFHPTSTDPGRQPDPQPFYFSAFNKRRIFFTSLDLADKNWEYWGKEGVNTRPRFWTNDFRSKIFYRDCRG